MGTQLLLAGLLAVGVVGTTCAQRPTAEAVRPAESFWPLDPQTGAVAFSGTVVRATAPALAQAEYLRVWLASTCSTWAELQTSADSAQLYQAQLRGVHAGVVLRFLVRLSRRPAGWHYQLVLFEVRSPTSYPEVVPYLPLHRLLDDPDFQPDVASFQQQLQRALPKL